MRISNGRYVLFLCLLFSAWWLFLALDPVNRRVWLLENVLALLLITSLAATYRLFALSRLSYTLIFLFLCGHEIGAHYSYAQVPYDEFFQSVLGFSLNRAMHWDRQNFDRIMHFLYGLLFAYPIRELFLRVANVRGFWGFFLPLDLTMSTSMMYELVEWIGGEYLGGHLRTAFLAEQGDMWDSQKDMALATLGAFISMGVTFLLNIYFKRDFAREWNESLRVKRKQPLGEEKIIQLLDEKRRAERRSRGRNRGRHPRGVGESDLGSPRT